MTVNDLIAIVLPRIDATTEKPTGITLLDAVNSIQSMIGKLLLGRRSDLLATADLSDSPGIVIPAMGHSASLPTGFIAMAQKPRSEEIYTDWMMGIVVSYDNTTGALVVLIQQAAGTDTLADWSIVTVPVPGGESVIIGASSTSLTVGTGTQTLAASPGMLLSPGDQLYILPASMPSTLTVWNRRILQPNYLNDDMEDHDLPWWDWYGLYGWGVEPLTLRPRWYRIIGTTIYVRPKVIISVALKGKYFKIPTKLTIASTLPWGGLFDEIFTEGTIRIIVKGVSIPESDLDFAAFIEREFGTVMSARQHLLPKTRTSRANFM
jgi:hypothetical protein